MIAFKKFALNAVIDSKFLMIKYIAVGIFLIILTVITNRFEVTELTYFNSVFSLLYFSDIFGYSIASGTCVYINQNIKNREKLKEYVKLGFIIATIISVIFCLILLIFKDFIFKNIIIFDVKDDYTFYYLTIPIVFLNIIVHYFENIFKGIKELKNQLKMILFKDVFILILMLVLLLVFRLNIYYIAIIYIMAYIIIFIYAKYLLEYRTEELKINVLASKNINNIKDMKIIKTILMFVLNELIWQIGYSLSALFLLKKSEILYNSYNYFENVLDIVNGFYFAILNICAINICRKMGERKKNEVYKEAKYTLTIVITIWVIFAFIYVIFEKYILKGANVDTINVTQKIGYIYLFIQLLRFIDWALYSYILNLGGKVKLPFIMQMLSLIYFITLFIFADKINVDSKMLILLVSIDSVPKIIVGLIVLVKKHWIVYLNTKELKTQE